ncbi:TRUD domain-containing protein [Aphelenchoides besseyi]|nr:TRUD domain-containing protein [Aphelenchoides besseyi]KAI6195442.1 TRUD domain-containing protein [Aphelenchoides besseyi]
MSRRKIVVSEIHDRSDIAYLSSHPKDGKVFAVTGDNRIAICRLNEESNNCPTVTLDRSSLDEPIRCLDFDCNHPRLYCASTNCFYSMDSNELYAADEFDFETQISCILALDRAGSSTAFNLVIGDDDGKISLLDLRMETPALVHQANRVANDKSGIVRMVEGADHEVFAVTENGIVTSFDLRRREFNDILVLEKYPTSIVMDGRKNPIVSTDVGDILWIKTSEERIAYKTKYPGECIEKLVTLDDDHLLSQFYLSDTLLLISNKTHKPLSTLTVDRVFDVATTIGDDDVKSLLILVDRNNQVELDIVETDDFVQTATSKLEKDKEFPMIRPDIGITSFLNDNSDRTPWSCIFKHFYSDFIVQEILTDGTRCAVGDTKIPEPVTQPEIDFDSLKAPEKMDEQSRQKILKFRREGGEKVTIDVTLQCSQNWSKDERRELHAFVRSIGGIDSTTKNDQIEVHKLTSHGKRRRIDEAGKRFVHFTMSKEGHDTNFAVSLIAKFMNRNQSVFGVCGIKDRRALTSQRISGHSLDVRRLLTLNERLRGIVVSDVSFSSERLNVGELWGNRFSVALRDFRIPNDEELQSRLTAWSTNGFINFYGDQRFGSWSSFTAKVGRAILRQDWAAAVELILKPNNDEAQITEILRQYEKTKDAAEAYKQLPNGLKYTSIEGAVLKALSTSPTNFKGALMSISRSSRCLYVHAYQSLIFNKVASHRAQKYGTRILDGDLFADANGELLDEPTGNINDVILPLPSFPFRAPANELADLYHQLLEADEIKLETFGLLKSEFGLAPTYRRFIERPRDVSWELVDYANNDTTLQTYAPFSQVDGTSVRAVNSMVELSEWKRALILRFDLPSGCYATMALRELVRFDLGKEAQRELSAQATEPKTEKKTKPIGVATKIPRIEESESD